MTNAISNLVQSILSIFQGLINAVLAALQGIYQLISGVVGAGLHAFEGVISFFWSNFFVLLLIGFAILGYQIMVVDRGNPQATRARVQKKLQ